MYILILDDGQIFKVKNISEDDKRGCADGLMDIIDPQNLKQYDGENWVDIDEWS